MPPQNRSANRFFTHYLPLIIWLVFISFASSAQFSADSTSRIIGPLVLWLFPNTTPETLAIIHFITRKLAHFTEYGVLGFLAARAFRPSSKSILRNYWFLISCFLVVAYALIDEYHQSFVPSRTASFMDSLIDMAGGLTVLSLIRWRQRKQDS